MTVRTLKFAVGLIAAASPLLASAAAAQSSTQSDYDRGYQAGRADAARANQGGDYNAPPPQQQGDYQQDQGSYDDAPSPPPPPPEGYDGSQLPPPPPGYAADPNYAPNPAADQRYEAYAENWASQNCIKSNGNTAGGAVIGGLFGALLGSSIAGYHNRGAGALVGGIAGAAGGAAVGSAQDNATSPAAPRAMSCAAKRRLSIMTAMMPVMSTMRRAGIIHGSSSADAGAIVPIRITAGITATTVMAVTTAGMAVAATVAVTKAGGRRLRSPAYQSPPPIAPSRYS